MASYKVFARWDDAAQLRWDSGHCEIGERYIRFYLEHRKNAQDAGNFVDIAKPRRSSERGAYHILCDARNVFKSGHVLPYIRRRPRRHKAALALPQVHAAPTEVPRQRGHATAGGAPSLLDSQHGRERPPALLAPASPRTRNAASRADFERSACDGFWGGDIMVLGSLKVSKCALL